MTSWLHRLGYREGLILRRRLTIVTEGEAQLGSGSNSTSLNSAHQAQPQSSNLYQLSQFSCSDERAKERVYPLLLQANWNSDSLTLNPSPRSSKLSHKVRRHSLDPQTINRHSVFKCSSCVQQAQTAGGQAVQLCQPGQRRSHHPRRGANVFAVSLGKYPFDFQYLLQIRSSRLSLPERRLAVAVQSPSFSSSGALRRVRSSPLALAGPSQAEGRPSARA